MQSGMCNRYVGDISGVEQKAWRCPLSIGVGPFRLKPSLVERVWGSHNLQPWYRVQSDAPIGEAWLSGDQCTIETGPLKGKTLDEAAAQLGQELLGSLPGPHFPLLVKILFPQDKLSVQVHPDDDHAARLGGSAQAKTECWYMLQTEPGATVALGLKPGTTVAGVSEAIAAGTLEDLLEHVPVTAGEMVYVSAGTMHAIGPGVVILEIQQNSDTTYRLYDYGRPRELHLERGLEVLKTETDAGKITPQTIAGGTQLIAVPHFIVERYSLIYGERRFTAHAGECLIPLSGNGLVESSKGDVQLLPGEAVVVPASVGEYSVQGTAELVRCYVPS
jgi:mannose-6-phosphate isomerase